MPRRRRRHGLGHWVKVFLYVQSGPYCALCGEYVDPDEATIDHRIPKSKGGIDARQNLQIAHRRCNEAKGNREDPR